jgi:hypothetical protein
MAWLKRRREPETAAQIARRVRGHWCPTTATLSDPAFRRAVEHQIVKAKRRGLFVPDQTESN